MRHDFIHILRCIRCSGSLELRVLDAVDDQRVTDGLLDCRCGAVYPIVGSIPRMLANAFELNPDFVRKYHDHLPEDHQVKEPIQRAESAERLSKKTQRNFGYQWTTFSEMSCDFGDNFWNYLYPSTPESFEGRVGLDAGCGFGRHIYHAATYAKRMVGMDFSQAIESTYENTKHLTNVDLVQADIYSPPFAPGSFDFVYSVGVLHHLPDPENGVRTLVPLVKDDGAFSLWVYSKTRWAINYGLEALRSLTTRLPLPFVKLLSFVGALLDRYAFVVPYQILRHLPFIGPALEKVTPPRVKNYSQYPFQVLYADWFDRLAAPIRFYYNEDEVSELMESVGLSAVTVSSTGNYGWRARGINNSVRKGIRH